MQEMQQNLQQGIRRNERVHEADGRTCRRCAEYTREDRASIMSGGISLDFSTSCARTARSSMNSSSTSNACNRRFSLITVSTLILAFSCLLVRSRSAISFLMFFTYKCR